VVTLADAYTFCERLATSHYENFPVASALLPRPMRPHIAAIYAFARTADDYADEGTALPKERLRQLDDWLAQLHTAIDSNAPQPTCAGGVEGGGRAGAQAPVFVALAETIRVHRLPVTLFEDLISAFKQDVTTRRYDTWGELLDYCRRSANPVGRLVLRVAGYANDRLDRASDAVCTALQLTNFWQDIEHDWRKDRVYVPREECDRCGAREEDLENGTWTPAWRHALAGVAERTRTLFDEGKPVCDGVSGRLRLELRFTWLGGRRILDKLDAAGFDVFEYRPTLGVADVPGLLWQAARWNAGVGAGATGSRT
jgi:hydroxysqualene synthase